ncbi:endonuclease VII domain-containing protein [Streptomyces sp. NPDC056165]
MKKYNITAADYDAILESQGGKCANQFCGTRDVGDSFSVDHDHSCCPENARSCGACIRGLLCSRCNLGIGLFDDSIESLKGIISYLEKWSVRQTS